MKNKNILMAIIANSILSLVLSSCSSVITTPNDALKYKNLSVTEFMSERYTSILGKIPKFKKNDFSITHYTERMHNNSSVLYAIYFSSWRQQPIYAPIFELNALCQAQNGKMYLVAPLPPVSMNILRPIIGETKQAGWDYEETLKSIIENTEKLRGEIFHKNSNYPLLKLEQWDKIENFKSKSVFAAYDLAIHNNAFGVYSCTSNNTVLWGASIQPNAYHNVDGSLYILYLLITGFNSNNK